MTTETLPNGVNAPAVVAFAQRLQAAAPAEATPFHAQVAWRGGFRNGFQCCGHSLELDVGWWLCPVDTLGILNELQSASV